MRLIAVSCALAVVLYGCGVGYSIEPARLIVIPGQGLTISELRGVVSAFARAEGFEDLGRDEEMLALLERSQVEARATDSVIAELSNRYTYLNRQRNLRLVVTDFTDTSSDRPTFAYPEPIGPFFEFGVYDERPGGFSRSGIEFLAAFQTYLNGSLKGQVALATPPPETDDSAYWRITVTNFVAGILNWLVVFGISVSITGSLSYLALKRIGIATTAKRGVFVLINTWLATPLPFPVAFILVFPLPNLLAAPWTDLDYYRRVQEVAVVSFPVALILCAFISLKVFRDPKRERGAA